jgi:hypothetical protein
MSSTFDKRIRKLEQEAEWEASRMESRKPMDHKQFARVIWYMIHNPRPNDTPAIVKERERLMIKIIDEQELTEDEKAWLKSQD